MRRKYEVMSKKGGKGRRSLKNQNNTWASGVWFLGEGPFSKLGIKEFPRPGKDDKEVQEHFDVAA